MPFDWNAFVELARTLSVQAGASTNSEAALRTSLSRAYYGAFGHARSYSRDWLGFAPRGDPDDHGRLRAHLRSRQSKGDADRLDRLRQWRNDADYVDDLNLDLRTAVAVALAEAGKVKSSLTPPSRA